MKKILLILLILIMPLALASNEYGKITSGNNLLIVDVDVKVDGLTSRNLDYGEEITKKAKPESVVIFNVKVRNNHTNLDMEDVEMLVTIEDLDLDDGTIEVDISDNDDNTFSVEFTIPSDAEDRDYDVFIEVDGKLNNTIQTVEYDLDLVVEVEEDELFVSTCSDKIKTMNESLHQKIADLQTEIGAYFEPYQKCDNDLKICKIERNNSAKDKEELTTIKTQFDTCNTDKTNLQNERDSLRTRYTNCTSTITTVYQPKLEKTTSNTILWILAVLAVIGGVYYNRDKLRKPHGEAEEDSEDNK